jgi:hypothetical protein
VVCARGQKDDRRLVMEGYCVKCRAKSEMVEAAEVTMKNGKKAMKGKCSKCGTGMFKIMPSKKS